MPASFATRGLVLTEHEFAVPLDHARPDGESITVFAREVADPDGRDRPLLVFLQGGPGSEAPRPTRHPSSPGWLDRALADFRVLMLDQRGTGRSTPIGTLPGLTAAEQAEYLAHFRADAIVRDAERIRAGAGRRALERARPELRRAVRHDLPVDRPRGAARGVRHRRARRRSAPRIDDVYRATYAAHARALPALLRALPRRPRARARAARAPRARRRPPARPATG